jgi:hypothetical protein
MNIANIKARLAELNVTAPIEFTWEHSQPIARVHGIATAIPVDDNQDAAFAEHVADIAAHPERYRTEAEAYGHRIVQIEYTERIVLSLCKQNLHCKPSHIVHVPEGTTVWRLSRVQRYPGKPIHDEFVTIQLWKLADGGTVTFGMSDDFDTVVIAGNYKGDKQ